MGQDAMPMAIQWRYETMCTRLTARGAYCAARVRELTLFVAIFTLISCIMTLDRGSAFAATMTTVAGDGRLGFADGPSKRASFIYPVAVARGIDGTIYVADAGAQRIRAVRGGHVATIAGGGDLIQSGLWVPGGYRDGTGKFARFDGPSGLAIDQGGRIFVSDTNNHCIRLIDVDGKVSTYAGSREDPQTFADGSRLTARFRQPLQLAIAKDGTLYVADFGNGVRKISPDGLVSTIYITKTAMGVAVDPRADDHVFVAQGSGLASVRDGATVVLPNSENRSKPDDLRAAMDTDVGHPYMITAIDGFRVFYTDAWTGAIRYLDTLSGSLHVLVGRGANDGTHDGAGFKDGPLGMAEVADPVGLTADSSGNIVVADAYNRRVREIRGLNLREALIPGIRLLATQRPPPGPVSIAVIGNSFVWSDTTWDDSYAARLETELNGKRRRAWVQPILIPGVTMPGVLDYLDQVVQPTRQYKLVVFAVNDEVFRTAGSGWKEMITKRLPPVARHLADAGIGLVIAYHPTAGDLVWGELPTRSFPRFMRFEPERLISLSASTSPRLARGAASDADSRVPQVEYHQVLGLLRQSQVPIIDLWPAFINAEKTAGHVPLFGTTDQHFSAAGRQFMGYVLAAELQKYLK